jgi:predicted HTH domain antitoxin
LRAASRIPEGEAEGRLRQELAAALYARGLLSFGKVSELAGIDRFRSPMSWPSDKLPGHYGQKELDEDLGCADGQEHYPDF